MSDALHVTTLKRWIAAAFAAITVLVALMSLGVTSTLVERVGLGADPSDAFVSTEALAADVTWAEPTAQLVRELSPADRTAIGLAWVRSFEALARAASGDSSGLAASFVDAALEQASARHSGGTWTTEPAPLDIEHRLRVDFVSLDKQIVVLAADITSAEGTERRMIATLVQVDGAWRVRTLSQPAASSLPG